MNKTGIILATVLLATCVHAQNQIEVYFGPKLYSTTDIYTQPIAFSDGTQVYHQPHRSVQELSRHFGGNVGVQIPLYRDFYFRLGTSYQYFGNMLLLEFPIEGPFETAMKGRSMSWHMFTYESALRYQKRGVGIEIGLNVLHRAVEADKYPLHWHYLSDEQNDMYNAYSDYVQPTTLMYHVGLSYRYQQFEFIGNFDLGYDIYRPVTYQNETQTPDSQIYQLSFGLNYHIALRKNKATSLHNKKEE